MATLFAFRPSLVSMRNTPLGRYLPLLPQGVAASWLAETIPPGGWVIDPFGASPQLAVEVAQEGYRIIVAANNPIAVAIRASAMPGATLAMVACCAAPRDLNEFMMPQTVPNRPI